MSRYTRSQYESRHGGRYGARRRDQGDEQWGQAAGTIGVLVLVFGCLATIKAKLGLSWPATALLTLGVLIVLGYLAWRVRTLVLRLWAPPPAAVSAATAAEAPKEAEDTVPAHPKLTSALTKAGAIGRDEIIRDEDVTVEPLPSGLGTLYDFLMPEGRTHKHVDKQLGEVAGMFNVSRLQVKLETSRQSERHVRLLVLNQPPFSVPFPPPSKAEIRAFAGVPLGHEVTGQLGGVKTFDRASLLIGGMTQMGKTTLVNGLITCLLIAYEDFDLYLLDGKLCGLTKFEPIAVRYKASDDPAVLENMLDELNGRVAKRYTKLQDAIRNRQPAPKFKPVFFIIDEAADFFTDDGTKAGIALVARNEDKARSLVAKSLESGISTVMLTQRPAREAIPVKVRDQFLYRMCLYVASAGGAKVALGDSYFDTVAPIHPSLLDPDIKGQGVLFANGVSSLIRGFNFSDEFIWGVVDEVADRRKKVLSEAPVSPLKRAIQIMEERGVKFMPTSELAPALGVTETDPTEAGKEVSKLLGVSVHRGTKGVRGYRLADLTAAAMSGV